MVRMTTKTHGLIDYAFSAIVSTLPKFFQFSRRTTSILEGAAGAAALYSAATDYEYGVVKALPMKAHLALDALSGAALLGAAMALDDEKASSRTILAGIGLFEIFAAVSTQMTSSNERGERGAPKSQKLSHRFGRRLGRKALQAV